MLCRAEQVATRTRFSWPLYFCCWTVYRLNSICQFFDWFVSEVTKCMSLVDCGANDTMKKCQMAHIVWNRRTHNKAIATFFRLSPSIITNRLKRQLSREMDSLAAVLLTPGAGEKKGQKEGDIWRFAKRTNKSDMPFIAVNCWRIISTRLFFDYDNGCN